MFQDPENILIKQNVYIDGITSFAILGSQSLMKNEELAMEEKADFKRLTG